MAKGRRTAEVMAVDTRPGQILVLALLANAPIALAFILVPLFSREDPTAGLFLLPGVWVATPLLAAWSVVTFARTPRERRQHNAARVGILLASVALVMWGLVLLLTLG